MLNVHGYNDTATRDLASQLRRVADRPDQLVGDFVQQLFKRPVGDQAFPLAAVSVEQSTRRRYSGFIYS